MAINRVEINDFLVFKGKFECEFCSGVNVLIGVNGTGKTTLMKVLYGKRKSNSSIKNYFSQTIKEMNSDGVKVTRDTGEPKFVFIPISNLLSSAKGLLELNERYALSFDQTQLDVLINAGQPETRELTANAEKIACKISAVINGTVEYENGIYYMKKNTGEKVEFALEASGLEKFGLLWKLLRNGLLEPGSVLFWDEPEASINPELIPPLVDVLLELSRN